MRKIFLLVCLISSSCAQSQELQNKLAAALNSLGKDDQFRNASISMHIVETNSGKVIFDRNGEVGLAPASCQKVVTSASAFALLGNNYKYTTNVYLDRSTDSLHLIIDPSGDPTLGSWRWDSTKMDNVYAKILTALRNKDVHVIGCALTILQNNFNHQPVPDGWIWQDIGNYYGAGAWPLNWHENQYDLRLSSGITAGDSTMVKGFEPSSAAMPILNYITTGKKGSGDNAYIYSAPFSSGLYATGTIPPGQKLFTISGAMPDPLKVFIRGLKSFLNTNGIIIGDGAYHPSLSLSKPIGSFDTLCTFTSPGLDSINYWFLKKSVNLYGEALVKTIALEKLKIASTEGGLSILKDFWQGHGISTSSLNMMDGSGLSPANRITTTALVAILNYSKDQLWFPSFYHALPEINGLKMKDGYINGVRSYAGYVRSKSGKEFSFAFIINNFNSNPASVREKMWKVLDILK